MSQAPWAYLQGSRLTLRPAYTMGSDMNHSHVRMYARVYTFVRLHRGMGQATRTVDDVFEQTTPARQKLSTEAKFGVTAAKFVSHQGLSCCYARPCVNVICPRSYLGPQ